MKTTALNSVYLIFIVCLVFFSTNVQAQTIYLEPYVHIGYLLNPPTDEELGGSRLQTEVDLKPLNYGFGLQILMKFRDSSSFRIGLDLGYGRIYSSAITFLDPFLDPSGHMTVDTWTNTQKERSLRTLGIFEFYPGIKSLSIQTGFGFYVAYRTYEGSHLSESTNYIRPSFMVALRYSLYKAKRISVPIIIRLDNQYAKDYGPLTSVNIMSGVSIKF
jgi:hypothetical protein